MKRNRQRERDAKAIAHRRSIRRAAAQMFGLRYRSLHWRNNHLYDSTTGALLARRIVTNPRTGWARVEYVNQRMA